ncbi:MAG: hypothetical protein GVY16_01150 [Planctomycetes bacterium]|jgi:hypothetical protein|nr:hypothetical protein [Phycisphaerae bacterium]NBB94333.1 hypothetical protein [Planctomycetota bacterium]
MVLLTDSRDVEGKYTTNRESASKKNRLHSFSRYLPSVASPCDDIVRADRRNTIAVQCSVSKSGTDLSMCFDTRRLARRGIPSSSYTGAYRTLSARNLSETSGQAKAEDQTTEIAETAEFEDLSS